MPVAHGGNPHANFSIHPFGAGTQSSACCSRHCEHTSKSSRQVAHLLKNKGCRAS